MTNNPHDHQAGKNGAMFPPSGNTNSLEFVRGRNEATHLASLSELHKNNGTVSFPTYVSTTPGKPLTGVWWCDFFAGFGILVSVVAGFGVGLTEESVKIGAFVSILGSIASVSVGLWLAKPRLKTEVEPERVMFSEIKLREQRRVLNNQIRSGRALRYFKSLDEASQRDFFWFTHEIFATSSKHSPSEPITDRMMDEQLQKLSSFLSNPQLKQVGLDRSEELVPPLLHYTKQIEAL